MVTLDSTLILNTILPVIGMIILVLSMFNNSKVISALKINEYPIKKFIGVFILLLGFLGGYALLVLVNLGIFQLPIDPISIVGIIYLGGAIFTWVATDSTNTIINSILGKKISDEMARKIFVEYTGVPETVDLSQSYEFVCEGCKKVIQYSIADVVRANAAMLERGISVESVFGVKSYILRPQHRCGDNGRREFTVIHDSELQVRSREKSRLLFKL